jgi:H+-transporting ATPase
VALALAGGRGWRELIKLNLQADLEHGLNEHQVEERIAEFGFNELTDDEMNPCLKFLTYFWGPMPVMIWIAIITELIKASITGDGWEDFAVLIVLQIVNGSVGYIEEKNAGNAIAALKEKLAPECVVIRTIGGRVVREKLKSRELVPGDVTELKLGDVVPADCMLCGDPANEEDQLQVDQSALTGESLPVIMYARDKLKMSSMIKQGEMKAVVVATGKNTFYGKAADLMKIDDTSGRFQKILFRITLGLLFLSLALCAIIFTVMLIGGAKTFPIIIVASGATFLRALSVVIVLLVASIPIAMQVVCTSTMAVGSRRLASRKVIVARLSAIEELAGMTVLCSDKTGTLTKNELTLKPPTLFGDMDEEELTFFAALAANRKSADMDAIDKVIYEAIPVRGPADPADRWTREKLDSFDLVKFVPFNPTIKRTEASLNAPNGAPLRVTKGAPQIVLRLCLASGTGSDELKEQVEAKIQEYADKGFRTLGVAVSYSDFDSEPAWQFQGLLSLFDPPRDDTADTIKAAVAGGVEVKMVTGDQRAIAVETCRQLEMGTEIFDTEILNSTIMTESEKSDRIFYANGFAEVMPEHKFNIVQCLRERGIVTGMTGDGVNDAPALKRADIGIAVQGATDAAKAAADIVLTEPGLSVIIDAIQRSRKIFQRMRNYAIYRIACTLQLLCFFFFAVVSIDPSSQPFYGDRSHSNVPCVVNGTVLTGPASEFAPPEGTVHQDQYWCAHEAAFVLPVISLVIITILNDGTIISIAHDKVIPANTPQKWDLWEVVIVATVLGLIACLGSMLILVFALQSNGYQYALNNGDTSFFGNLLGDSTHHYVTWGQAQTIMYLKVSISDFLTVFAARTRSFFWERRPGYALGSAFIFATASSTLLALFWPVSAFNDLSYGQAYGKQGIRMLMAPLSNNPYAVVTVWVYCILWFFIQDLLKVATYYVIENYISTENHDRMRAVAQRAQISTMLATEDKHRGLAARMHQPSSLALTSTYSSANDARVKKLEEEIKMLKKLLVEKGVIPAEKKTAASAAAASHHH